jgi:GTP-binding protein
LDNEEEDSTGKTEFYDKYDEFFDETVDEEQILSAVKKFGSETSIDDNSCKVINLAIMGKPNTGKSTLSNKLTAEDNSIVSDIPGTTRDIVEGEFFYKNMQFRLMDTAGIRRKNKVTENVEYYSVTRAIKAIDTCDVVYMVIDAEEGLSGQDKKIAGHVVKKGKGIVIVVNKWDKIDKMPNAFKAMEDRIRFLFPVLEFAPVVPISALEGTGIDKLLKTTITIAKQLDTRITTAALNSALREWVSDYPPPASNNKVRYKIKYATQTSIKPSRFLLFVNKTKGFPEYYRKYIKNKIKQDFKLNYIPFEIDIKETEN